MLAGGADDDIRAAALERVTADGAVAYVALGAGESSTLSAAERALEDLEDLGAPAGYLVDVLSEDDATLEDRLGAAGMVVIEGSASAPEVRSGLLGAAAKGIEKAYQNGAVLLLEGSAAAVFATWLLGVEDTAQHGLGWLDGVLLMPGVTSLSDSAAAQAFLNAEPVALVVGIGVGSALALGPDGQIELWGKKDVAIALGRGYRQ